MKHIIVTGGTGFIGTLLVAELRKQGNRVTVIDQARQGNDPDLIVLDLTKDLIYPELIESADAIIHLVGTPIFQRWTDSIKQEIYKSRILSTRNIVRSIELAKKRPTVFITASAVGYYGDTGETIASETTKPGDDFLAKVCIDWEVEARQADSLGVRTIQVRTAPVLGNHGILKLLKPLYQWGLGGLLGTGNQWFPWIHIDDVVGVYLFALTNTELEGPVNAVAPDQIRYRNFVADLGKLWSRPTAFNLSRPWIKLLFGEFGEVALNSQRVEPRKLLEHGFVFAYPKIDAALHDLFHSVKK